MTALNENPFDDSTPEDEAVDTADQTESEGESQSEDADNTESEDDAAPPAAQEEEDKAEKLIPEHRFKAALKSVTEERDNLKRQLNEISGEPAQDMDLSQVLLNERINLSREVMMETKQDYEQMENLFAELASEDPTLSQKMIKSSNPAKFAYKTAKDHLEIQELRQKKDEILKEKESDDWQAFQKWKAEKANSTVVQKEERKKAALKTPDLTKATSVKTRDDDQEEDVFSDSPF